MELDTHSPTAASELATHLAPASQPMPPSQPESGNSRLADILAKKARGEKLSRSEAGFLGGVRGKASNPVAQPAASNPNPLLVVAANPENPLFDPAGQVQAVAPAPVAPAYDSAALRRTADALLSSCDIGTKMYVGYEAKQAGSDKDTIEIWKNAVAMQDGNRKLMVEGADPIILWLCEKFKCAPDQLEKVLKSSGFAGGAFMHIMAVWTAVKAIRESKAERQQQQPEGKK